MLESYHNLQLKPITVPEFKDSLQLIDLARLTGKSHRQRCERISQKIPDNSHGKYWQLHLVLMSYDAICFFNKKFLRIL